MGEARSTSPTSKLFVRQNKDNQRNQNNPDVIKICRQASLPLRLSLIQFATWIQWPGKNENNGNKFQTILIKPMMPNDEVTKLCQSQVLVQSTSRLLGRCCWLQEVPEERGQEPTVYIFSKLTVYYTNIVYTYLQLDVFGRLLMSQNCRKTCYYFAGLWSEQRSWVPGIPRVVSFNKHGKWWR